MQLKKFVFSLLLFVFLIPFNANATPVTVDFSFDTIATGSFSYDSALDGGQINYGDLDSFQLDFAGISSGSYDLAFINSGGFTAWHHLLFDSSTDSFLTNMISGYPTTLAAVKIGYGSGFFVRDAMNIIIDYTGGGAQSYSALTITKSNPVPEPSMFLLLGSALAGLAFWRRRQS
jgi:hypothetical protein